MSAHPTRRAFSSALLVTALACSGAVHASDVDEARAIVDKARISFDEVARTRDFDSLRAGLKSARGVLIFPSLFKGGFVVGGGGGTGVLLVRGEGGAWSQPAFYTLGSASVGLQAGAQAAEVVILINSQKGVDQLLTNSLKLGGDASIAIGPVGVGRAADLSADFVSYTKAKGAFAGLSVEGSVLDVRDTLNRAYYGNSVTPLDILVKHTAANKQADALRASVAAAGRSS